jgi:CHAT domain-containing protein/uncharacterized protein HemY
MRFVRLTVLALSALAAGLTAQTTRMKLGKTIPGDLSGGETHWYSVKLKADQYLQAVVSQPVAAVLIDLEAPDGKKVMEVDTRNFPSRPSRIVWVSETTGEFRVGVSGSGHYEIKLKQLRRAVPDDSKRVEAERLFLQGLSQARGNVRDPPIATFTRALDLYREVQDREREGDMLTAVGSAYRDASQGDKAIGYYEQALVIRRETKDRQGEELTLNELGVDYDNGGQYENAIGCYERALALARDIKDLDGEGGALKNLGNAYTSLSEYEKAAGYQERALAIFREVKDRYGEGATLANLGSDYEELSQPEKAIGFYERALVIFREVKSRRAEGVCLYGLAGSYMRLSQNEKAIGYLEQALVMMREVKDRRVEGHALNALGWSHTLLGQYEKAIGYYQQALAVEREAKDLEAESTTLIDMGTTQADLGDYQNSIGYYEQALAIKREIKERWGEGTALENLCWSYASLKQYEKGIGYCEQALVIQREIKDRQGEGEALEVLGGAYRSLHQHEKAIGYEERALAIAREIKDRKVESRALNNLGTDYLDLSQSQTAIRYYEEALGVERNSKDGDLEAGPLSGLMDAWRASGRPRLAIFYGKQAVNAVQTMRSGIRGLNQDLQRSFLKDNEKPYHTLAEILIAEGRLAEAEQVLALLKEEEFFQYIRRDAAEASSLNRRADLTPEEAEYEKRYREIGDQLMSIGSERGDLLAKKTLTAEQTQHLAQLEKDLAAGNFAFERFLGDLTQHFSGKPETAGRIDMLRETQGVMEDLREFPAGTVAILTLIGDDKFHAILRTPDAQKAYEYPIKAADLNRKIVEFRQAIQDPRLDPRPLARELYNILIAPMAADLRQANAQTLMWSLDGALRYLPLAALYDGQQYLIEQYRVSVMTLASESRLKDRPDQDWKAAAFGVTKGFEDAPALPSVLAELTGIVKILGGESRLDDQFTQASMRQILLKRYQVVHIASHFRFQPGNDTKSFLLLGDGGHLSLAELKRSANLFGGVQLLTLSACNTGVGDGAEVEGFGTLAQRQGAKAVVASLWSVADESTSLLMQEFYRIRESQAGITKLEALREAQLALLRGGVRNNADAERDRGVLTNRPPAAGAPSFSRDANAPYAHPYYWAPFFLMGNWL